MTDQPTEGWLATKCTVCGGTRRRPLASMPGVRHVAAPVTPCSCRTGFFVHKGVPAVSVVESDRRVTEAVRFWQAQTEAGHDEIVRDLEAGIERRVAEARQAERDRCTAIVNALYAKCSVAEDTQAATVSWHWFAMRAAAGIESGEPA